MKVSLRNGNVLDALKQIPDDSVDCIITSPPYYGLRMYEGADTIWDGKSNCKHIFDIPVKTGLLHENRNGLGDSELENTERRQQLHEKAFKQTSFMCSKCGAWKGQLGNEPTYQQYIEHIMMVTRELKRVLKKTGTMFWNMGDSYSGSHQGSGATKKSESGIQDITKDYFASGTDRETPLAHQDIEAKSLMMMPERVAIAMIDEKPRLWDIILRKGYRWILRNKLVWYKRNAQPESVKDRFSRKWEYVFFFVKNKRYYFNLDKVRKKVDEKSFSSKFKLRVRDAKKGILDKKWGDKYTATQEEINNYNEKQYSVAERKKEYVEKRDLPPLKEIADYLNENRLRAGYTLDEIDSLPFLPVASHHWFAGESYPSAVHWMALKDVLGFDDKYDKRMTSIALVSSEKRNNPKGANPGDVLDIITKPHKFSHFAVFPTTLVEPLMKAGCPENGVVLDPFAGSGTVGVVAQELGMDCILIELSAAYCNIIRERMSWGSNPDIEYEEVKL